MPKIKEIKKFGPKIKEIKKEVKAMDLEEEISEGDTENFAQFIGGRRFNAGHTLDQDEAPQQRVAGFAPIAKEDEDEMHFRPNYVGGGNPYQDKSYSTQMEKGTQNTIDRDAGSSLRQEAPSQQMLAGGMGPGSMATNNNAGGGAGRPEQGGERQYVEARKRDRDNTNK